MDGNGRWAKKRNKKRLFGHSEGSKTVKEIVTESRELGIEYLTLYAFSRENWKRPRSEVKGLFNLLNQYCEEELQTMLDNDISFNVIGEWTKLPTKTKKILRKTIRETSSLKKMKLTLALNYSSRREILVAVKKMISEGIKRVTEKGFEKRLFTSDMPDPDLLIRTSGEKRISNFLLWQLSYTELAFTDTLWPDFTKKEYRKIIEEYTKRERRYGGL